MALTTSYDRALTEVWDGYVGGTLRWIAKHWGEFSVQSRTDGGLPTMELPAYSVLDLNASIARGPLMLRAFVRNLTDTRAKLQAVVKGDATHRSASLEE